MPQSRLRQETDMEIYGVNGLVGLIILALDIWAIVNVLQSGTTTGNKVLWVILIAILPVVGLVLWLLMGPRSGGRAVV
jgi:hypothetical protein